MFPCPLVCYHYKLNLIAHLKEGDKVIELLHHNKLRADLQNFSALHLAHVEEELLSFVLLIGEETKLALHSFHVGSQLLLVRLYIQRKILCLAHLRQGKFD